MVAKKGTFDKPNAANDEIDVLHLRVKALQKSNAQMTDAIDSVREGFAFYDADERLVYCNDQYRNFYPSIADKLVIGATLEELTRAAYEAGTILDPGVKVEMQIEERLKRYRAAKGSHEQLLKDGRWLLCSDRRTPAGGIACIRTDITEQKQAEKERRLAKDQAEATHELFSKSFHSSPALLTISSPKDGHHIEVNETWSSITGYSRVDAIQNTVVELGLWVNPEDRSEFIEQIKNHGFIRNFETVYRTKNGLERDMDYLSRMQKASGRMSVLINDLLSFSRITTEGQTFEPVDLGKSVAGVLDDLEILIEETGAQVSVGTLPVIDADPLQSRQLFQNLIGNAIKYRHADRTPEIIITAEIQERRKEPGRPHTGMCVIRIEDNGIGFSNDHADKIFEIFQRLHGRDVYQGTGVGLAIARRIAERHGGDIKAEGKPDVGATFIVTLSVHHENEEVYDHE